METICDYCERKVIINSDTKLCNDCDYIHSDEIKKKVTPIVYEYSDWG